MRFLSVPMVMAIHSSLVRRYGGGYGLRDEALLESAVARPRQVAQDEPEASMARIGAFLAWGLMKNHAFVDGNKRIGLAALVTFLRLNGHRLTCTEAEETVMVLRAAGSEIDEAEWTAWVERSVAPL